MGAIDIGYQKEIILGPDSIIIRHYGDGIKGGKVLDMADFTPEILKCGHVVIKNANDTYKPMPLNSGATAYASLPSGYTYVGLTTTSIEWGKEGSLVGIITDGEVNDAALPYDFSTIASAFKAAVPTLRFDHD